MREWSQSTVGQVAQRVTKGTTPTTVGGQFTNEGITFVKVESIGEDGRFVEGKFAFIDAETNKLLSRSVLQVDDVLFTIAGTIGRVAQVPENILPANTNQAVAIVRPDPLLIESRFLYYVLRDKPRLLSAQSRVVQSVQANFSLKELSNVEVPLPSLTEQHVIASLLGALDDKIDLNRRMNETLEEMARALFKDWFVDFGPTKAKMEGREPYLEPDLWALFPERLDGEGKPEGWATKPLDKIADFLNGLALQKYPAEGEDDLPVIKIAELRSGVTAKSGRASRSVPEQYIVNDGNVLFSWSGSLTHLVWTGGQGALNQHLFKVTSSLYPKWFFYFWIGEHMPEFQTIAASKATTMGHIQRRHLTAAETFVPTCDLLGIADDVIAPLFNRRVANSLESRTLAQTRDLLLPKLISGEIGVREAEQLISEVV